jgi:hypothetical protein
VAENQYENGKISEISWRFPKSGTTAPRESFYFNRFFSDNLEVSETFRFSLPLSPIIELFSIIAVR